jgi:hypothetical protein
MLYREIIAVCSPNIQLTWSPNSPLPCQYLVTFASTKFNVSFDAALTVATLTEVQHSNFVTVTCRAAENPGVGKQMLLGNQEVTL